MKPCIPIDKEKITSFCRKYHIRRLSLFGSVLKHSLKPESDIDVLVEFESNHIPGLSFFTMEDELSNLFGRRVDLNTPSFLSKYFRDNVMKTAQIQYETT